MEQNQCEHTWEKTDLLHSPYMSIQCSKCGIQIELYPNHLSIWDYAKHDHQCIKMVDLPRGSGLV